MSASAGPAAAAPSAGTKQLPTEVVVHPLVLLSVVDHFTRTYKDNVGNKSERVVGILLGEAYKGKIDITNSYAGTN